jgi:nitrate reductase assembly molybdenum cofactor insertion protein NarJ
VNELLRALATLIEEPGEGTGAIAEALAIAAPTRADHAALTLFTLYPHASVYLGADGMAGGEAADRVAGFWRAIELTPPAEPDHLAGLLALAAALDGHVRRALLDEHLLPWLPAWLTRVTEVAPPPYVRWAVVLREVLGRLGEPVDVLPVALREATPAFAIGDDHDADTVVRHLLVPVATGVILVRDDLRRAADDLGLGLRVAERRYALRALLEQDAAGVLAWLAAECRRQADLHDVDGLAAPLVRAFHAGRARSTAAVLETAGRGKDAARRRAV